MLGKDDDTWYLLQTSRS